jgi:hypothetical protein
MLTVSSRKSIPNMENPLGKRREPADCALEFWDDVLRWYLVEPSGSHGKMGVSFEASTSPILFH